MSTDTTHLTAPVISDPCGTSSGYQRHRRNHQRPCLPCTDAHNQVTKAYRIRHGGRGGQALQLRTDLLGYLIAALPDEQRDYLAGAIGKPVVDACLAVALTPEVSA